MKVIAKLLKKHGFIGTRLVYREKKETYQHIVETIKELIICLFVLKSYTLSHLVADY